MICVYVVVIGQIFCVGNVVSSKLVIRDSRQLFNSDANRVESVCVRCYSLLLSSLKHCIDRRIRKVKSAIIKAQRTRTLRAGDVGHQSLYILWRTTIQRLRPPAGMGGFANVLVIHVWHNKAVEVGGHSKHDKDDMEW